ncbi:unnamed protein product [Nippostrongylus brasiliensis]|uniref:G_PROTEIN_RECEP_F1_2 domain-containing protein n=1 Tax=Nippostrongylus brasiliensis TaxID=27835 RepID=A0A158QYE6_NIPBR|nr:unnamed protein product [Nippostrongylus brasiliensis]
MAHLNFSDENSTLDFGSYNCFPIPVLAWAYVFGAPVVFPVAAVFQTSSVYFCVAAAVDCFIAVVLPESVRQLYCTPRRAKVTCMCIMIICILYNIPHFFELEKVNDSDTISLILVVFFFIFCNFTALLVNFMEIILNNPNILVYFVDLSNLLVVINGTANFFCYLIFGASFRNTLKKVRLIYSLQFPQRKAKTYLDDKWE